MATETCSECELNHEYYEINLCPLHAAASALLAAARDAREHAAPLVQQGDPLGLRIDAILRTAIKQAGEEPAT